ncbi:MAG: siroheme synthase CysG [Gammaproteobacteria bacterium]
MSHLPVFLHVESAPCLIAGGGEVAARKVNRLLRSGARVTVVAPVLASGELADLARTGRIAHLARAFADADLDGCRLAIAATDDRAANHALADAARARGIPVNVVDDPAACTFIMPSIVDRAPVQIAISTGGASPVLARLLRARLETMIPSAYGGLATLAADLRERMRRRVPDARARRRFWETVLQGPVAELLFAGREAAARRALDEAIESAAGLPAHGEVYLIGAGPGDPDLLTFRALRLMQQADVVVYDRLVNPALVDLVRRDAERIYVGKRREHHTVRQEDINRLLADLARAGKRVVRLKGGDPFIFGRGGEEIETLAGEGVAFQIVPGITAASGCASYAGIPLTHRDYAQSVVFVTGHVKDGRLDLNWPALVQPRQTLAVYMGVGALELIGRDLCTHGLDPATPAALVEHGTTERQRVLIGTIGDIAAIARAAGAGPPGLLIVGEVVRLHEKLAWFHPAAPESSAATG